MPSLLSTYLSRHANALSSSAAAYFASLDSIAAVSPSVAASIAKELQDQRRNLKLIASENYSSLAVQLAQGNLLTDKYAEGFPYHRFYAGCENVDAIESEAADLACQLFGAEHAFVQPHSGADANLVAFLAVFATRGQEPLLKELGIANPLEATPEQWQKVRTAFGNQKLLAMDFYSGGHLTHGYRFNISGLLFDAHSYSVDQKTKLLDLDALREQVRRVRPTILLAGYSAYPRKLNFARLREMADEVGAVFMVDMAHFAGLVAGKVFTGDFDPIPHAHIVTSTTHKTLRGPRGGLILCKKEFADAVNKACPAVLGGPLPHAMAARAVAFRQALTPEFRTYAHEIVRNSESLAREFADAGIPVLTGGSDNHIVLLDVAEGFGLTGRQAESALRNCGITLNRNALPFDQNGPWYTSGLRVGTAALSTLGMGPAEMREIAALFQNILSQTRPSIVASGPRKGELSKAQFTLSEEVAEEARAKTLALLGRFPLYPEIDDDILSNVFGSSSSDGALLQKSMAGR
ncbi:MAG: glycine hydroxymethyltransferase [Bryobacterales bacterium]|nr:glycine hydroxymethyltransferase [Bryobacterales bacterium]